MGFLTAARLAVLQGQAHRGNDLLDALFALGEDRGIARFCLVALGEQIRMHALQGRVDTCQTLWRRLDERVPDVAREQRGLLGPELGLVVGMASAYVTLVQRDWQVLLDTLVVVNDIAERLRHGREIVQIKLLKALFALRESGQDGLSCLLEAISLAEEYGLHRIVGHPSRTGQVGANGRQRNVQVAGGDPFQSPPLLRSEALPNCFTQPLAPPQGTKSYAPCPQPVEQTNCDGAECRRKQVTQKIFGKFQAGTRKHVCMIAPTCWVSSIGWLMPRPTFVTPLSKPPLNARPLTMGWRLSTTQ